MIITRTPFRISFFGGGTDFPDYYREHGGLVLSTAIQRYCFLSLHPLSPLFSYRFRASYSRTETVQTPGDFQHPLIRETLLELDISQGLEITHFSDLPGQTGLGSSSSFTVGLVHALQAFAGGRPQAMDLARMAIRIERERVGDAGGVQDQLAAAAGGFNLIHMGPDDHFTIQPLPLPPDRVQGLEDHLMLFYMGQEQSAMSILVDQTRNIPHHTTPLGRLKEMALHGAEILRGTDSLDAFGRLLHECWTWKKALAEGITNSAIDQAYEQACAEGALGGKLLGAGGRGFLLLYANPDHQPAIRQALTPLKEVDVRLNAPGSTLIYGDPDE